MIVSYIETQRLIDKGWEPTLVDKYVDYCKRKHSKALLKQHGKTTATDSQVNKFYNAEFAFTAKFKDKVFSSIEEVQSFVDDFIEHPLWDDIDRCLRKGIVVEETNLNVAGCAEPGRMWLNPKNGGLNLYTVLHELVHCAGYLDHDVGFRQALQRLVNAHYPWSVAIKWQNTMKEHKLQLSFRSTKAKSIDEWYKGYKRAAKMREKRDS